MPTPSAHDDFAPQGGRLTAVLGPTNTGKTHYALERMLAHRSGLIGLPLRLLAREIYDGLRRPLVRDFTHSTTALEGHRTSFLTKPKILELVKNQAGQASLAARPVLCCSGRKRADLPALIM